MVGTTSPLLHTKAQAHWSFGSREEDLYGFAIYGRGGHLGHVTKAVCVNFWFPAVKSLHMKLEFDLPGSF